MFKKEKKKRKRRSRREKKIVQNLPNEKIKWKYEAP